MTANSGDLLKRLRGICISAVRANYAVLGSSPLITANEAVQAAADRIEQLEAEAEVAHAIIAAERSEVLRLQRKLLTREEQVNTIDAHRAQLASCLNTAESNADALARALAEVKGFAEALEKHSSKGTGGRRGGRVFAAAAAALAKHNGGG